MLAIMESLAVYSTAFTVTITVLTTLALLPFIRAYLSPPHPKVLPSPLKTTLAHLPPAQLAALDYTPSAFPSPRDVPTPYGSVRAYEFGNPNGRKTLLIHGISTTCQTLGPIATALAARGRRVLIFDLFGRGFSDGVGDLPHDARLYVSQALCVLASSELAWTGDGAFDLVGYSMGGGIAVHFAAAFPRLVRSVVLLAPAGLIRAESFGVLTRWVFQSGLVPERLLAAITRKRLQKPIAASAKRREAALIAEGKGPVELAAAEMDDPASPATSKRRADGMALNERVMRYVRWMLVNHRGFVPAFMACIKDAPMVGQHEAWAALGRRAPGSVCVVLAKDDEIIDPEVLAVDALPLLGGRENVAWEVVPGGHDFPMTHDKEALGAMYRFWGMEQESGRDIF